MNKFRIVTIQNPQYIGIEVRIHKQVHRHIQRKYTNIKPAALA